MAAQDINKAVKKLQKSYFDVLGLCCSSEVPLVENILKSLEGVKEISVIVPTKTVIVVHDSLVISQIHIVKALNQARLEANVRVKGEENFQKKWPSPYAIACGFLLLVSILKFQYKPLQWLALGAVAVGIYPICMKAVVAIRNLRLDINILMIVAVIGTIAMGDYLEAGTIVFLFTVADWLESRASHKANAVMSSLMSMSPQKAVIAESGEVVDADEVKLNTILAVKAGQVIPIDGLVVDGNCEVDEKTLTGESLPVSKQKDSTVWAGTINLNGYISIKTTALAEECAVAKMAKLVEEAQNSKTSTQRFIDKCAKFYTPAVIIISISIAVVPTALRVHNRYMWFHLALVVLVSACPCALILSTPVATFCALTKAATSGLLIKGGDYLEILAKIKIIAFDKTGTLTRGEFVVMDFQCLRDDISLNTLLDWVSSIESKSSHPMAAALVEYGRSHFVEPKPEDVEEFQNFVGEGIHGKIHGKDIYIGNKKIAARATCKTVPEIEGYDKNGKSIGYIYCEGIPTGMFTLSDRCRSGIVEALKELKKLGIKTAMLTGDNQASAWYIDEQLDHALDIVKAELLPNEKARIIKEFQSEGPTAMIGDGLNDAPALATADIGISMGISGSALATETGNVILLSNDIKKIPKAIQLSKKCTRKVIENVILSITTKVAILGLAIAGHPLVWAAVLADVGTCLLVILNSMLLLQGSGKHAVKCGKSSLAPHVYKNGCNDSHIHSHHKKQRCCSNSEASKVCSPQKCCFETRVSKCQSTLCKSSNTCNDYQCRDNLANKHDNSICADHKSNEAKHSDHGSFDKKNQDLESQTRHNHSCSNPLCSSLCMEHNCLNRTIGEEDNIVLCERLHEAKKCNHSVSSLGERQNQTNNGNYQTSCDEKRNLKDGASIKATKPSCAHDKRRDLEGHHCSKNSSHDHTSIDIITRGNDQHVESTFTHTCANLEKRELDGCCKSSRKGCGSKEAETQACMSLEKREIGGCCKDYMKECCGEHGHLGAGFGGGLSEIVISE